MGLYFEAYACPPSEGGAAIYFAVACALSVAVLVLSWRRSVVIGGSLVIFVLSSHQLFWCHVPSSLWAHSLSGIALLRGGCAVLHSESGLLHMPARFGLMGSMLFVSIIVGEVLTTWMHFFHNYVHCVIYTLGALLAFSGGCEDIWGLNARSTVIARRVRRQRHVIDPTMWSASNLVAGFEPSICRVCRAAATHVRRSHYARQWACF